MNRASSRHANNETKKLKSLAILDSRVKVTFISDIFIVLKIFISLKISSRIKSWFSSLETGVVFGIFLIIGMNILYVKHELPGYFAFMGMFSN